MKELKLTIDLLPRGAWGKNFSKVLPKHDWDVLRMDAYERANHKCSCCGYTGEGLEAHEVWDFDIRNKTQTLVDIVALCTACHGVKHIRHSQMIGYGEQSKRHFMKVNDCSIDIFAAHYIEAESLFNERNKVERWEMNAPLLDKFGIEYERKEWK